MKHHCQSRLIAMAEKGVGNTVVGLLWSCLCVCETKPCLQCYVYQHDCDVNKLIYTENGHSHLGLGQDMILQAANKGSVKKML